MCEAANHTAIEHEVPRMTLQNRVSGRVAYGNKSGPKPYLISSEEKEVTDILLQTAKAGYGRSRKQIIQIVRKLHNYDIRNY